jgi:hypothetical protein
MLNNFGTVFSFAFDIEAFFGRSLKIFIGVWRLVSVCYWNIKVSSHHQFFQKAWKICANFSPFLSKQKKKETESQRLSQNCFIM